VASLRSDNRRLPTARGLRHALLGSAPPGPRCRGDPRGHPVRETRCADRGSEPRHRSTGGRVPATSPESVGGPIGMSVVVVAVPIALVQPPLVLACEFVVEDDAINFRAALVQAVNFAFVGAVDL